MWHVLVKEPGNEAIFAEILKWFNDRLPLASNDATFQLSV
jgi:hypothetical protein